jgi:hypothetical protein
MPKSRLTRVGSALATVTFTASLVGAIAFYWEDQAARRPIERHINQFELQQRRPDVVKTVGYAPSADWAADIVADAAARDAYEPIDLSHATPEERAAWIRSMMHLSDELHSARDVLLGAIRRRPGWPFHYSLLGQVVLTADTRDLNPELTRQSARWSRPLLIAANAAPGATSLWQQLAVGYVQTWPALASVHGETASIVLRNAFVDPEFVRLAFPMVAQVMGPSTATRDLPESPKSLLVASDYFAQKSDIPSAWELRLRWERAEWAERVLDLEQIQKYSSRGDIDETRNHCERWLAQHSVWDFDSASAHAQALRLLALWPGGSVGPWRTDRFADVVRYLLTRNEDFTPNAGVLLRVLDSFSDVPPTTLAQVRLAAGDVAGAERIARSADDAGSLEWSPYLLMLARRQLVAKQLNEADLTLTRLPAAALRTRGALKVRSDIATARGSAPAALPEDQQESLALSSCGRDARMSLGGRDWQTIRVQLRSDHPLIADVGMNDARSASLLVENRREIDFRLMGYAEHTFWMKTIAGDGAVCAEIDGVHP